MAWIDLLKAAFAAKQRAKESKRFPLRFDDERINEAARRSPEAYLRRHFADVVVDRRGKSLAVPKILRADFRDGRWVSCDWSNFEIGGNISLVMWVQKISFVEAVHELIGVVEQCETMAWTSVPANRSLVYPRLPPIENVKEGRAYLHGRGISSQTVAAAEAASAVRYCRSGLLFLGWDWGAPSKAVRSVTVRYIEPLLREDGTYLTKRVLEDSDEGFPVILLGDRRRLVIVEGAINGLAVQDMAIADGQDAPLVVVTGRIDVRQWVSTNAPVRATVEAAARVEIWFKNGLAADGAPEAVGPGRTDVLLEKLGAAIAEVRKGEVPTRVYPPAGVKDAADWLRLRRRFLLQSFGVGRE